MKLIVEERGKLVTYQLDEPEPVTVGRALDNTIPIRDASASRHHLKIASVPQGVLAQDLGSKNGTLLNGKLFREHLLRPGDCLRIGDVRIWFEQRSVPAEAAPAGVAPRERPSGRAPAVAQAPAAPQGPAEAAAPHAAPTTERPAAPNEVASFQASEAGAPPASAGPLPAEERGAKAPAAVPRDSGSGRAKAAERGLEGEGKAVSPSEPTEAGRFALEAVEGDLKGQRIPIDRMPFRIGRLKKSALVLQDAQVSAEHCEIVRRPDGCAIVDLGSTNGTKVNGSRVRRAVIGDGARIEIGASVFVFRDARAARPGEGAPDPEAIARWAALRARAAERPRRGPEAAGQLAPPPAESEEPAAVIESAAGEEVDRLRLEVPAEEGAEERVLGIEGLAGEAADRRRALLAAGLIVVAVVVAGVVFAVGLLGARTELPEADPSPRGNAVSNWSFEEVSPSGAVEGWNLTGPGTFTSELVQAPGGLRAGCLRSAGAGLSEVSSAEALTCGAQDVALRGFVRGGRSAAGLAVLWESSTERSLRMLSATDLAPRGEAWRELRSEFRPPPGADRARVLLLGDSAWFDRIVLSERTGERARPASRVEVRGLAAWADERGSFGLVRDLWPLIDRAGLALVGEGAFAPFARQECALEVRAVDPRRSRARAGSAPGGPALFEGALLAPSGGRVAFTERLGVEEGALAVRYVLERPLAEVAPAIVLYVESAARVSPLDLTLASDVKRLEEPPFTVEGVRELALGMGGEQVSFRLDPALAVTGAPLGRGLVFTFAAQRGAAEVGFSLGRGSTRGRDEAISLWEQAEQERKAGMLEEARRLYGRVAREAGYDPVLRERAREAERALQARAEALIQEASAIEGDINAVGVPELLDGAEERCRFAIAAFAGNPVAAQAESLLARLGQSRLRLVGAVRLAAARELLAESRRNLEARRYHLARYYLRRVLERYGDLREATSEARRDLEFVERQLREKS